MTINTDLLFIKEDSLDDTVSCEAEDGAGSGGIMLDGDENRKCESNIDGDREVFCNISIVSENKESAEADISNALQTMEI